jgi:cytidine deaminase
MGDELISGNSHVERVHFMLTSHEIVTLIEAAQGVYGEFALGEHFSAGSCAAAVMGERGGIHTGICIDLACGIGFCAEHAAIAEMLKTRETRILAAVAVASESIVPPCGRCRELMLQIDPRNMDTQVILARDRVVPLRDLLPHYWNP